jgi:hypothetical protein
VLSETASEKIEMRVDGELRTQVSDITALPVAALYDEKRKHIEDRSLLFALPGTMCVAKH